ncbi:MAG: hypothetical protein KUG78_14740 [Kangiellaceae bacterium]|nr:hypothetical protein [Kangiellaceae bacterium]
MPNPYRTPIAEVRQLVGQPVSRTKWKVFFWIMLFLELTSVFFSGDDRTRPWYEVFGEYAIYSAVLLGLFGFSYNKVFFVRGFWKALIPITFLWDLYTIASAFLEESYGDVEVEVIYAMLAAFALVALPMMIFQYMALYFYGFRSSEIWNDE